MQRTIETIKEINDEVKKDQDKYLENYYEELNVFINHEANKIKDLDTYDEYELDEIEEDDEFEEVSGNRSPESLYHYQIKD